MEADFEAMLAQYGGICKKIALEYARKAFSCDADFDDYLQEILFALYSACKRGHAPASAAEAFLACKGAAFAYAAKSKGLGISKNRFSKWLETHEPSYITDYRPELHDNIQKAEDDSPSAAIVQDFISSLPSMQREIVLQKSAGYSDGAIAKRCGLPRRSLERQKGELRRRFTEYFGYDPRAAA